ncbi:MAG: CAP domain-containing protein [Cyanobacteria bacterium P01_A01_bin.84]
MIRQAIFGIVLGTVVLTSGLTSTPLPGHSSTKVISNNKPLNIPSNSVAVSSSNFKTSNLEKVIFEQINRYRAAKGLSKLKLNVGISQQARVHSLNMAKKKVPFSHNGFEKRVTSIPLRFTSAAENVAFNQGYNDPAAEAVRGWLESPGHYKSIVGNYDLTGIGVAINEEREVYLTQIFLRSK